MSAETVAKARLPDGSVAIDELARILLVTKAEVAAATGLSTDSVWRTSRTASPYTQKRMNELVRILERVAPWAGHPRIAFAWFRSQQLSSFGSMTAEDLVKMGRVSALEAYLDRIDDGGFV